MRWQIPIVVLLVAGLVVACDQAPTAAEEAPEATTTFKVEKKSSRFTVSNFADLGTETYIDCLGETLIWYGTFDVIWSEWVTPAGNWIATWKLDYFDTTEPTWLLGEDTGTIWNVVKAENQGTGWLTKDRGPQDIQHFQSNEWYVNEDGDKLHIRTQGRLMYDADGAPKMERNIAKGFCH